jgi:hypothetical protein
MFAPWIPDALRITEELCQSIDRPAGLALTTARQMLVNTGAEFPMPSLRVWKTPEGNGIYIDWDRRRVAIGPGGGVTILW